MKISSDLVIHILKLTNDPKEIASQLEAYKRRYQARLDTLRMVEDENKRHAQALKDIKEANRVNQANCDHPIANYYGDPSGGRDSFHQCDICGKEW